MSTFPDHETLLAGIRETVLSRGRNATPARGIAFLSRGRRAIAEAGLSVRIGEVGRLVLSEDPSRAVCEWPVRYAKNDGRMLPPRAKDITWLALD